MVDISLKNYSHELEMTMLYGIIPRGDLLATIGTALEIRGGIVSMGMIGTGNFGSVSAEFYRRKRMNKIRPVITKKGRKVVEFKAGRH